MFSSSLPYCLLPIYLMIMQLKCKWKVALSLYINCLSTVWGADRLAFWMQAIAIQLTSNWFSWSVFCVCALNLDLSPYYNRRERESYNFICILSSTSINRYQDLRRIISTRNVYITLHSCVKQLALSYLFVQGYYNKYNHTPFHLKSIKLEISIVWSNFIDLNETKYVYKILDYSCSL